MSELKHTPGEWRYDGVRKIKSGNTVILDGIKPFSKHGAADATLIACAPQMLAALIEIGKCLQNAEDRIYERELIERTIGKATK
jgi:hypothetical protein